MSALLAKAIGLTLAKHPLVNAAYVPNGIKYNANVNVAKAVAMPDGGLIRPVLKNVDKNNLYVTLSTSKLALASTQSRGVRDAAAHVGQPATAAASVRVP
eukprot:105755-Pleurochrysis_carterae.AAC.1